MSNMKQTTMPCSNKNGPVCWELCEKREWYKVALRCHSHPLEARYVGVNGETPLMQACRHSPPVHVVRTLLAAYPNAASKLSKYGLPLHFACRFNASVSVLKELVTANPGAVVYRSEEGNAVQVLCNSRDTIETNLTAASTNIDVLWHADPLSLQKVNYSSVFWQKMLVLLEGAARHRQRESTSESPLVLHAAVELRCGQEVFEFSLAKYPDQIKMRDCDGRLPLHIAVRNRPENDTSSIMEKRQPRERHMIVRLLETYPVAAQLLDPNEIPGRFPIHTALSNGHKWHNGVRELFLNSPDSSLKIDPIEKICPFAMSMDVDTTYQLLRNAPSVLFNMECTSKEKYDDALNSSDIQRALNPTVSFVDHFKKPLPVKCEKDDNPDTTHVWNPRSVNHFVFRCSVWGKNAIALRCSGPFLCYEASLSATKGTKSTSLEDRNVHLHTMCPKERRQQAKTASISSTTSYSCSSDHKMTPTVSFVDHFKKPLPVKCEKDDNPDTTHIWNPRSIDHFVFRCSVWGKNAIALRCSGPFLCYEASLSVTQGIKSTLLEDHNVHSQRICPEEQRQQAQTVSIYSTTSYSRSSDHKMTSNQAPLLNNIENDDIEKIQTDYLTWPLNRQRFPPIQPEKMIVKSKNDATIGPSCTRDEQSQLRGNQNGQKDHYKYKSMILSNRSCCWRRDARTYR